MKRTIELVLLLALAWAWSCSTDPARPPTGGETHFLSVCSTASDCGGKLECVCSVCTLPCLTQADCDRLPAAACVDASEPGRCASAPARACDAPCASDADCRTVSSSHRCTAGSCRAGASNGAGGGGAGGSAGAAGSPACADGDVSGNQVLVIGDSVFGATHQITAYLEELARSSGALAEGERYRDQSAVSSNTLAFGGRGITSQYTAAVVDGPVSVVIMNGGGTDTLLGTCAEPVSECAVLTDAAEAATDLFAQMASDGVAHVVYAFYPDYEDVALREKVDTLRPLIDGACAGSPVPCHLVDLRPVFEGHLVEYTDASGILPSAAGSEATARALWSRMQSECVAQ